MTWAPRVQICAARFVIGRRQHSNHGIPDVEGGSRSRQCARRVGPNPREQIRIRRRLLAPNRGVRNFRNRINFIRGFRIFGGAFFYPRGNTRNPTISRIGAIRKFDPRGGVIRFPARGDRPSEVIGKSKSEAPPDRGLHGQNADAADFN